MSEEQPTAMRRLEEVLAYLCRADVASFDAYVINALERIPVPGLHTFAVAPRGNRYLLFYDPEQALEQSLPELIATLRHEVLHLILNHVPRMLQLQEIAQGSEDLELFTFVDPLAADYAVNEFVRQNEPRIADPAKPLGYWAIAEHKGLPPDRSYEEYVTLLLPLVRKDRERMRRIDARTHELLLEWAAGLPEEFEADPGTPLHALLEEARKPQTQEKTDA